MVYIEALIMEVGVTKDFRLGVQWQLLKDIGAITGLETATGEARAAATGGFAGSGGLFPTADATTGLVTKLPRRFFHRCPGGGDQGRQRHFSHYRRHAPGPERGFGYLHPLHTPAAHPGPRRGGDQCRRERPLYHPPRPEQHGRHGHELQQLRIQGRRGSPQAHPPHQRGEPYPSEDRSAVDQGERADSGGQVPSHDAEAGRQDDRGGQGQGDRGHRGAHR